MAIEFYGPVSNGGLIEYSWSGAAGDHLVGAGAVDTSSMETNTFIAARTTHLSVIQVSFNIVGVGGFASEFLGTINHSKSESLDSVFYRQDTEFETGIYRRWNNNAGVLVPEGSHVDFTWTNTDNFDWGLSVFIRTE